MIKLMSLDKKSYEALLPYADSRGFLPERGDSSAYFRYLNPPENWEDWVSEVTSAFKEATSHIELDRILGDGKKAYHQSPESRLIKCFCGGSHPFDPRGSNFIFLPSIFPGNKASQ